MIDVETPALLLDRPRFKRNCAAMIQRVHARGSRLRPHLKTLKSIDAAQCAIDPRHGGIAVSTLTEAEHFAAAGITDIQLALCLAPGKLDRAARLAAKVPGLSFFVDSVEAVTAAGSAATRAGVMLNLWIEVDCGEHRTGVAMQGPLLVDLARLIEGSAALRLAGVATHAGHAYALRSDSALAMLAGHERATVLAAAAQLRDCGIQVRGISAGSTPTAVHARDLSGLTEMRAGVFMAGDLFQSAIGSMPEDDIALSVLASVISVNRDLNQVVLDAGGLALSKDRSTADLSRDRLWGAVRDADGEASLGDLHISSTHQEHGEIRGGIEPLPFDRLAVGTKVRILANHACMTAAMYDRLEIIEDGRHVATWHRVNGWR